MIIDYIIITFSEAVVRKCSVKKVFLEISQSSQENTCAWHYTRPYVCNFIKNEALAQVFSCELRELFKNRFLYRTPLAAGYTFFHSKLNPIHGTHTY